MYTVPSPTFSLSSFFLGGGGDQLEVERLDACTFRIKQVGDNSNHASDHFDRTVRLAQGLTSDHKGEVGLMAKMGGET